MPAAPPPADELRRLSALRAFDILDTPPEAAFDRLARIASHLLGTPIALVSLVDSSRQWFKSAVGLEARETPRDWAFCAHAILNRDEPLMVSDAAADGRFRDNPLVTGDPHIRFYAGAPIVTRDGYALGTVCAIDRKPRQDVGARETAVLKELAAIAADELELRLLARQLHDQIERREAAERLARAAEVARLRAEAESARRHAAASLVRLTGGIAHEFNNLFTGVTLLAERLRDRHEAGPAVRDAMTHMLRVFARGARLTHGMLSYSGRQMLRPGTVAVPAALQNAVEMLTAAHKELRISAAAAGDCPPVVADERQLVATLAELVANACEAAAPDAARVEVTAAPLSCAAGEVPPGARAGRFVRISVADDGPGMTPEVRAKALEPFFTTKEVGRGPGLGLSMADGFARQSGGFLALESRTGAGTVVSLYLPVAG